MSVNTGRYVTDAQQNDEPNEASYRESQQNDQIDSKYGFDRIKDTNERTGYLINMHSNEILDADRRLVSALDLFFNQMDGSRFKATVVFQPYFLVLPADGQSLEVARYIGKKYAGRISSIEHVQKEDLDLANHLSGLRRDYLRLSFPNNTALMKVRRELAAAVRRNSERDQTNTHYIQMLSSSLAQAADGSGGSGSGGGGKGASHAGQAGNPTDYLDSIVDIREYDVPLHIRVSIDLQIHCGLWYDVRCKSGATVEAPTITARPDILDRPEPVILAYDIETTKLPLKFPDAQSDQIMMISYMIDGQGYLITNREIIAADVDDFEYTPKPEFEGHFAVFNEPTELALLQRFFDHVMEVKPHVIVSYNGDFFDWPFVETRAAVYGMDMRQQIGFAKSRDGNYLCRPCMHMDCFGWVKRDSYLPVGSQGLKAVAKAKLRYDPVELDPEEMCRMAVEKPQVLANYSVSDAVATYYLYMKYVNPFIFALATIIPMEPDEVLRKGSGTLCETLLMVQAFRANVVFPNKQQQELNKLSDDGHVLDAETYVGGHVEALESGVFRADIPCRFRLDQELVLELQGNVDKVLAHAIEVEEGVPLAEVENLAEVRDEIVKALKGLHDIPNRLEQPVIYHLDVGAMYPNIILTNRLQPSALVSETDCAACDFNRPDARCKRNMDWMWRGEMLPASKNEFQRIQQQLETEKFPPLFPNGPQRAFHQLPAEDQAGYEKKRLTDYCRKAYKKTKLTRLETRQSTVCQMENSFYVDTVRAFRDRRYEYKGMTKQAKAAVGVALAGGDAGEIKAARGREVLYDSLQLAHKCILNSFYGYVMRRGARWHSMPMAGIVCLTGAHIIKKAREIVERIGRPLELDTDGIWCILPASFPQEIAVRTRHAKKKTINISYPNAVLNTMVKDHFTNDQYHELVRGEPNAAGQVVPKYETRAENSIFFEVDGPYLAMVLPASKEEGKKLKKRYAVFNFDGSLAELKGFEVKRRGELQLIKIFQSSVFEAFLGGSTLEECYASVAKVADYWLDVLYTRGCNMPDTELFELISENRSMSKKLDEYGAQKSTSISTARRLAEFLGDQMVKDAGLACKYIISKKPEGAPVTERAIPMAIFQSEPSVRRHYLRRWLKDNTMGDADIRDVLDWNYYIERLGGTIQKIITIPAALQGLANPVPRVCHPDWLHKRMLEKNDVLKQRRINEIFGACAKPAAAERTVATEPPGDIEDMAAGPSGRAAAAVGGRVPIVTQKRRRQPTDGGADVADAAEEARMAAKTWREALGAPPELGDTRESLHAWVAFHRRKWAWQKAKRQRQRAANETAAHKRSRNEPHAVAAATSNRNGSSNASIGGFLKRTQRSVIEQPWQIVQIHALGGTPGEYIVWAMIGEQLHRIRLTIPRIFYVNQREPAPAGDDARTQWKRVHRVLPRSRPVHHLYQYAVPETVFRENRLGMLADLATPGIEGIYETQMTLEFRAIMDLGCVCSVQREHAKRMAATAASSSSSSETAFSLDQLEFRTLSYQPYLADVGGGALKRIYLYQHGATSGKREMWGLFLTPIRKAIIVVLDTVRTNQMPNMRSLYAAELAIAAAAEGTDAQLLPPADVLFEIYVEVDVRQAHRHVQRMLRTYRDACKAPTLLCCQSPLGLARLTAAMPQLAEWPQTQVHISDEASLLSGLDWQRAGVRAMLRHYLNLNAVLEMMLEQCRYFYVPVGNMPADTVLFGADLFYARHLQRSNFVLWTSPTGRPDLGGREADDSRLLAEFEDNITVVQNRAGWYGDFCVELSVDSLAVSALLQAARVQEMEGASAAITFDVVPQASLDGMVQTLAPDQPNAALPSYDETALCSAAFRVMRSMVNGWLREVSMHRNVFSDYQIVHFYRWVRSSGALLYDPALRRALNNLMRKLFLQIVAEFKRLGATIVYADFNRIILGTGKKSVVDALGYVEYVVQSIRNKELFHSVHLSYVQCWEFLLWMDQSNFSGVRGKIPRDMHGADVGESMKTAKVSEVAECGDPNAGDNDDDDDDDEEAAVKRVAEEDVTAADDADDIALDMNWNMSEQLTEDVNCREYFETVLTAYMECLAERMAPAKAVQTISHRAFEAVQQMHKQWRRAAGTGGGPALTFVNALCKILAVNEDIADEVNSLRRNMLRLTGVGEFSDMAVWRDPYHSYVLHEVICRACNHCRDIDLLKDKDKALKDNVPVWLCPQCYVHYANDEIEVRLLDVLQRKVMSYTLQDLRCKRCKQIKRENMAELCSCAGNFETLIDVHDIRKLLETFGRVADSHQMALLREQTDWMLKTT